MTAADDALDRLLRVTRYSRAQPSLRTAWGAKADVATVRDELQRLRDVLTDNRWQYERAEAAEAKVERLREGLRELEEDARQGKIHSESVRVDQDWPVHETIHRFSVIRGKARALLANSTPEGT